MRWTLIDIEFYGERRVLDSWQDLFSHYCNAHPGLNEAQIFQEREDKYAVLLYEISQVLGYTFGKTYIRDNIYRPTFHGEFEEMDLETRRRILDLLKSDSLPVRIVGDASSQVVSP